MIYDKSIEFWNNVFSKEEQKVPSNSVIPIKELEEGMNWLIHKGDCVLDFGCGNGTLLFYAELKGASKLFGIDISEKAIEIAKKRASLMSADYSFINDDVKALETLENESFDSVILSNIIDNLTEDHMLYVLDRIHDLLKKKGRLLIKMNDYIEKKDYNKYDIKVIDHDLVDDGLLLLNKPTKTWRQILTEKFNIEKKVTVFFKDQDISNRMFLLKRK